MIDKVACEADRISGSTVVFWRRRRVKIGIFPRGFAAPGAKKVPAHKNLASYAGYRKNSSSSKNDIAEPFCD